MLVNCERFIGISVGQSDEASAMFIESVETSSTDQQFAELGNVDYDPIAFLHSKAFVDDWQQNTESNQNCSETLR